MERSLPGRSDFRICDAWTDNVVILRFDRRYNTTGRTGGRVEAAGARAARTRCASLQTLSFRLATAWIASGRCVKGATAGFPHLHRFRGVMGLGRQPRLVSGLVSQLTGRLQRDASGCVGRQRSNAPGWSRPSQQTTRRRQLMVLTAYQCSSLIVDVQHC
jgi:hypothetical protein